MRACVRLCRDVSRPSLNSHHHHTGQVMRRSPRALAHGARAGFRRPLSSGGPPKVCLVIGAGAGIGGHVARRFASEGYHAVLCRRSDTVGLQTLVGEIQEAVWMQKQRDDAAAHTRRVYVCARARAVLSLTRRSICVSVCMHVCVCVCVCMHACACTCSGRQCLRLANKRGGTRLNRRACNQCGKNRRAYPHCGVQSGCAGEGLSDGPKNLKNG